MRLKSRCRFKTSSSSLPIFWSWVSFRIVLAVDVCSRISRALARTFPLPTPAGWREEEEEEEEATTFRNCRHCVLHGVADGMVEEEAERTSPEANFPAMASMAATHLHYFKFPQLQGIANAALISLCVKVVVYRQHFITKISSLYICTRTCPKKLGATPTHTVLYSK
jgi:hypothetical protein